MLCGGRRPRHGRCCLVLRSGRAVAPARHVPIAGDHAGWAAIRNAFILKLLRLSEGTFRAELLDIAVGASYVVAVQHATAHARGKVLDLTGCQLMRIESGLIQQVRGPLLRRGVPRQLLARLTRAHWRSSARNDPHRQHQRELVPRVAPEAGDRRGGDAGTGPAGVGGRAPVRTRESERRRATDDAGHHIRGDDERKVAEQTQRQAAGGCRSESVLVQRGNVAPALREESARWGVFRRWCRRGSAWGVLQGSEQGGAVGDAQAGAGVPAGRGSPLAVVPRGDVSEPGGGRGRGSRRRRSRVAAGRRAAPAAGRGGTPGPPTTARPRWSPR